MAQHYVHDLNAFFSLYRETCCWFSSIGFDWAATRYGLYERHFSDFEAYAISPDDASITPQFKQAFDNAYIEANEVVRVYTDLRRIEENQFLPQVRTVLSGQEFRARVDNDKARDFLFELSTAARFLRAGYDVSLSGLCDVVATTPQGQIFIECKRLKSINKVAKNVKKASEQIKKRLSGSLSKSPMGLIALNITDLISRPSDLMPDSAVAAASLHELLSKKFVREHSTELISKSTSKRLLGSMIESSAMWYFSPHSSLSGFSYTRHTTFIQKAKPEVLEALAPRICDQDIINGS